MKDHNSSIRFTVAALMMLVSQTSLASAPRSSSDIGEKARASAASGSSCTAKTNNDAHNVAPAQRGLIVAKALGEPSAAQVRKGANGRVAR